MYNITLGGVSIEVFCDMETDGGGWTVFYRRQDGSMTMGYSTIINGVGHPSDPEFVTNISNMKTILETMSSEFSLLINMKEAREHAFALY